jgi:hypothetical protein
LTHTLIMKPITKHQLTLLQLLIKEVKPEMVIPSNCSYHMAQARINWLKRKKANPNISKRQYMK